MSALFVAPALNNARRIVVLGGSLRTHGAFRAPATAPPPDMDAGFATNSLKPGAYVQLHRAGVTKYLGQSTPVSSTAVGDGGVRNQSAAMDLAKVLFPDATQVTLAGSEVGGAGVAGFGAFLARFEYGNAVDLMVFNDAGWVTWNLDPSQAGAPGGW